MRDEVMATCNS